MADIRQHIITQLTMMSSGIMQESPATGHYLDQKQEERYWITLTGLRHGCVPLLLLSTVSRGLCILSRTWETTVLVTPENGQQLDRWSEYTRETT